MADNIVFRAYVGTTNHTQTIRHASLARAICMDVHPLSMKVRSYRPIVCVHHTLLVSMVNKDAPCALRVNSKADMAMVFARLREDLVSILVTRVVIKTMMFVKRVQQAHTNIGGGTVNHVFHAGTEHMLLVAGLRPLRVIL
jgi:hypothetical protein